MKSVLFVSIAFPPKFDSEGLQVAKYVTYLKPACRGHFHLDVVPSAIPTLNMPFDPALQAAAGGFRQVVALPLFENRYTNYLLRRLWPGLAWSPDSKFAFHWQWRRVVKQLGYPPDLIYSRSFPASSAIMAMKLKKFYGVPWIMHLSDPWADSPHIDYSGRARQFNQVLERRCFETADAVCLTSRRTMEYFAAKYPDLRKRLEFYPNVYDPIDIPDRTPVAPPTNRKIRLVHTGGLAGSRTPEPFLRAVADLPDKAKARLDIVLAGHVDRANREVLRKWALDCVTYLGPLESYKDALALQQTADVLVQIDFPVDNPDLRVYFLSKLLDYQITGKPILAITDIGSECEAFIRSERGNAIDRHNVTGIRDYLLDLVERRVVEDQDYFALRPLRTEYDARFNAHRLVGLFQEFCS